MHCNLPELAMYYLVVTSKNVYACSRFTGLSFEGDAAIQV